MKTLLAVVALVLATAAGAQESLPRPASMKELFDAAIELSGNKDACLARPGGCVMPAVVVQDLDDANTLGRFDPRTGGVIQINSVGRYAVGTVDWNVIVVHEFSHYLDWLFGRIGPHTGCAEWAKTEERAYKTGADYYARFGVVKDYSEQIGGIQMMAMMCLMGM